MLRLILAALFCFSIAPVVKADPIQLTSGLFTTIRSSTLIFHSGVSFGVFQGGSTNFDCQSPLPCIPLSEFGFLSTLNRANAGNGGTLVLGGVTYTAWTINFFLEETIVTGTISVYEDRNVPVGTPALFSVQFFGYGFLTITTDPDTGEVTRRFQITSAPVPEPASLVLLGLGLAGIAARRFRRPVAVKGL